MGINDSAGSYAPMVAPHLRSNIADALFSSTQQRVLGLLFGQPQRSFFATEIIKRIGAGSGAVQRELKKLQDSGLVTVTRLGNQKHYQANRQAPVYPELCELIRKTVGLVGPLREALASRQHGIDLALIYGSVASGAETADSDIDMLVVSDHLALEDVIELLAPAEQALARPVNPILYTTREFERRRRGGSPFLARVLKGETIPLIGTPPDAP